MHLRTDLAASGKGLWLHYGWSEIQSAFQNLLLPRHTVHNVQSIFPMMTRLLSTFLVVALFHDPVITVFIMLMCSDEWSPYQKKTTRATRRWGYWKRWRLADCPELRIADTCILPELIVAEAALLCELPVEKRCSGQCISFPPHVCVCNWVLLCPTVSGNLVPQAAPVLL